MRRTVLLLALLAVFGAVLTTPAAAYIVVLDDGTEIATDGPPRIDGDRAVLRMPNGTETFIDRAQIDQAATRKANEAGRGALSGAQVIDGIEEPANEAPPPPPPLPSAADLARARASLRGSGDDGPARRPAQAEEEVELPTTRAGFVDLGSLERKDYPNPEIQGEVLRYLRSQGVDRVNVYRATGPDRILLHVKANNDAMVFKVLEDTANALGQLRDRFPGQVRAIELYMATDKGSRAGQFVLTPELAELLATKKMSPESFFLRYVEF